jgi:hypothetical protein
MNYLIMAFACWRISALFSYECGPWDIFKTIREKIGVTSHANNCEPLQWRDNFIANLFGCVWCLSVYVAIMIYVCFTLWPGETILFLSPFAISTGAIFIERIAHG